MMSTANTVNGSNLMQLYHFTDLIGIQGIAASGQIAASTNTMHDAIYGQGVYTTTYGPENSKTFIAINNYDGGWGYQLAQGKVDHCVEFKVPTSNVEKVPLVGRDVYVHRGPIDLNYAHSVKFH